MKRILSLTFVAFLFSFVKAANTLIPNYFSYIAIEDGSDIVSDSCIVSELSLQPTDKRFSIAVLQDTVSKDRIKSIKRQRAAYALSVTSAILGAASSVVSVSLTPLSAVSALWQSASYSNGLAITGASSYFAIASKQNIAKLKSLPVTILFSNNTEQEMCVNDLNRGLFWFVRPMSVLSVEVGNPETNNFRIAYADYNNPQIAYATIQTVNYLEDVSIIEENKDYWVYEFYRENQPATPTGLCVIKNKRTQSKKIVQQGSYSAYIK